MIEEDYGICQSTAEKSYFYKKLGTVFIDNDTADDLEWGIDKVKEGGDKSCLGFSEYTLIDDVCNGTVKAILCHIHDSIR